jgi:hypothetical protein
MTLAEIEAVMQEHHSSSATPPLADYIALEQAKIFERFVVAIEAFLKLAQESKP